MIDEITLEPLNGSFNVADVIDYAMRFPFAFRDPLDPSGLLYLPGHQPGAEFARTTRLNEPERGHPYGICLVRVEPERIVVSQVCAGESLAHARKFLEWVTTHYVCRITDDWGNDLTEECAESLDPIYVDDDDD